MNECKLCNKKYVSNAWLTRHVHEYHDIDSKIYYDKYYKKEEEGYCKWCKKELPFRNINAGYQKFCTNTKCNVLWNNKYTNRHVRAGISMRATFAEGDKTATQIGYWLKKYNGDTEKAKRALANRQNTGSLEKYIERHGEKLGKEKFEARQIKWQNTLTSKPWHERERILKSKFTKTLCKNGWSKISQKLFREVQKRINIEAEYATKGKGEHILLLENKKRWVFLDFYIKKFNCAIEFLGGYWHKKTKEHDLDRHNRIIKEYPNLKILYVHEIDYINNKEQTIRKCINYINECANSR